jgi:hypothetical protein
MRAERPILLRFLNVLTSLNGFIIKGIRKQRKRESNAKFKQDMDWRPV